MFTPVFPLIYTPTSDSVHNTLRM